MSKLTETLNYVLEDQRITPNEVAVIRNFVAADGVLDNEDVRFLVELLSNACDVCDEFDELFFPILKQVMLADGRIDESEKYHLLKMLYSDGEIRASELNFLAELREEAFELPEDFDTLIQTAADAHPTNWSVGGAGR